MAVNRGWAGMALGARRGGGSQSQWAGNPSEARRRQFLTTLTHNRCLERYVQNSVMDTTRRKLEYPVVTAAQDTYMQDS